MEASRPSADNMRSRTAQEAGGEILDVHEFELAYAHLVGGRIDAAGAALAELDTVLLPDLRMFMPRVDSARALHLVALGDHDAALDQLQDAAERAVADGSLVLAARSLRDGIRYSTGATVVATDVARGLRRAILADPDAGRPGFFRSVVGAARCIDDRASPDLCDLSQGVDADDTTRRVTIRLVEPDPELLYKLAYFVVPAPPGTPMSDLGRTPLPGTGPYAIASSGADGSITPIPGNTGSAELAAGDALVLETPGGGGWGSPG